MSDTAPVRHHAAIDIGSQALRLLIAEGRGDQILFLDDVMRPTILGRDVFTDGRISASTMDTLIEVMGGFKQILRDYGVANVKAIATESLREATNRDALLVRIRSLMGFDVHVLEPAEEALLTWQALKVFRPELLDDDTSYGLMIDMGGGSTRVMVYNALGVTDYRNEVLGTVRLVTELRSANASAGPEVLGKYLQAQFRDLLHRAGQDRYRRLFWLGPPSHMIRQLVGISPPDPVNVPRDMVMDLARKTEDADWLYSLGPSERDIVVPALQALSTILQTVEVESIWLPGVGLRHALAFQSLAPVQSQHALLAEQALVSARARVKELGADQDHAATVAHLAGRIFDGLRPLHDWGDWERTLLLVSAWLHEVGKTVSNRDHQVHAQYIINNSGIFGLDGEDSKVVACVVRYHRRGPPRRHHQVFMTLDQTRRVMVTQLAAILRLAIVLDTARQGRVRDVEVRCRPDEVLLSPQGVFHVDLELWQFGQPAKFFEDIFGVKVRLIA